MKVHDIMHELQQTAGIFGRNQEASVIFEGTMAYTNGKEIVLPAIVQTIELTLEQAKVFRGYLDHEAGHLRHTNFPVFQEFCEANSGEAKHIFNCLEDMRLERKVMEEYPGSRKNLRALSDALHPLDLKEVKADPSRFSGLNLQTVCAGILSEGRRDYGNPANAELVSMLPEKIQEWSKKWIETVHTLTSQETMMLALEIEKLLDSTSKDKQKDNKSSGGEGQGLDGDPSEFEFDKDGDPTKQHSPKDKCGKAKQTKDEVQVNSDFTNKISEWMESIEDQELPKVKARGKVPYRVLTTRHDEVYTRNSVNSRRHFVHDKMKRGSPVGYETIKTSLGGTVTVMKAKLRRALMAVERRDWDYAREYGRLDTKRLVAATSGAPNVFKQPKDREELDTAVHLLVDLSGSMLGKKIEVAQKSITAFCECLEGTQIRYQVSGFSSGGGGHTNEYERIFNQARKSGKTFHRVEPTNHFIYKKFNEPLQVAKGSVACIRESAGGNNSDRDAVLWALNELQTCSQKRKVLMVLSDGQPLNDMLNENSGNGPLVGALKDAIDECTKAGVQCVGIGILTKHVRGLYPQSVSIEKVDDLSGAIFGQLTNILVGGKIRVVG